MKLPHLAASLCLAMLYLGPALAAGTTAAPTTPPDLTPTYDDQKPRAELCAEKLRAIHLRSPSMVGPKADDWVERCKLKAPQ